MRIINLDLNIGVRAVGSNCTRAESLGPETAQDLGEVFEDVLFTTSEKRPRLIGGCSAISAFGGRQLGVP